MVSIADPGLARAWDAATMQTPVEQRVALVGWLRQVGQERVRAQADRAGLHDPYGRAVFILDRLYPRLPQAHRVAFRAQLRIKLNGDGERR